MAYLPLRLAPGADLRRALEDAVKAQGASAFVVSGIGSLVDASLRFADASAQSVIAGPLEIVSIGGSLTADGAHLHMTVADQYGRVTGGHVGYGNVIRTTAEILLVVLADWSLHREHDPATGFAELMVRRRAPD